MRIFKHLDSITAAAVQLPHFMKSKFKHHFLFFILFYITQIALYAQNNTDFVCSTLVIKADISPACQNGNNGRIDLTIENGMPPYRISWENGTRNHNLKSLSAGIYKVQVADALECKESATFTVSSSPALQANVKVVHNKKIGKKNGAIDVQVFGGHPPYGYSWISSSLGIMSEVTAGLNSMKDLPSGIYKVVVFDSAGCYYEIETEVRDR